MTLIEGLSVGNTKGDYSLIMSQNGSNKISMLRAIARMWCFGKGTNRSILNTKIKNQINLLYQKLSIIFSDLSHVVILKLQ